jgi:hypothetical protein
LLRDIRPYDYSDELEECIAECLRTHLWHVKYIFKNAWARLLTSREYINVKKQPDFSMSHPLTSPWIFEQPTRYLRGVRRCAENLVERIDIATSGIWRIARKHNFSLVGKLLTVCMFVSPLEEGFRNIRWQTHRYTGEDVNKTPTCFARYLEYFYPGHLSLVDVTALYTNIAVNVVPIEFEYNGDPQRFKQDVEGLTQELNATIVSHDPIVMRAKHIRSDVRVRLDTHPDIVYRDQLLIIPKHYLDVMSGIWESNELLPPDFDIHCGPSHGIFDEYRRGYRVFRRNVQRDDRRILYGTVQCVRVDSLDVVVDTIERIA